MPSKSIRRLGNDYDSVASIESNLKAMDQIMANEIDMLSLHDRNAIYEEIHGVSNMATKETPEIIENALQKFEAELENNYSTDAASNSNSANAGEASPRLAYDIIMNQQPANKNLASKTLLRDDNFRLRFLRFVFFDVKAAVARMLLFLNAIHTLYGLEALKKFDTSMNFFIPDGDAQAALRAGYIQLLPFRDRSGRRIIVFLMDALRLRSEVRIKIFLYMSFVASGGDAETQRNGCLFMFWPGVDTKLVLPEAGHRGLVSKFFNSIPTRFVCFHFCFPKSPLFSLARAMLSIVVVQNNYRRIPRMKFHSGERMEMQYELMGYGIPVTLIPTTETGTLKAKTFKQWIKAKQLLDAAEKEDQRRRADGQSGSSSKRLECPGLNDVIFRSAGKSCMLNPGNVVFRGIFEKYHDEHVSAGQTEKRNLVWKIVEEIEARDGKFLTWEKRGWWIVLENRTEIRSKVATSLRDYNKQQRAIANEQSTKSSTFAFERQDGKRRKRGNSADYSSDDNQCG
eukprot:CAMPEP_0168171130 /NCGR_PEP_ID=MMETSP0139_2-20121125/4543_1 /TAXON_ID=44445 /ORGANISM="Pseudo-nitzschia australis, Strain 10249 10 AB" /LENGTH=511 /DNA_ID=CAMNT_0008088667 /DNA_START=26 /DNA_END=1558 /DNA_ORIENTATION=+